MKMLLAAIAALCLLPLSAHAEVGAISGAWSGSYTQRIETGDQTVTFTANINGRSGAFTGMTREPNRTDTGDAATFAVLTGRNGADGVVTFTKTYGSSGWSHSVAYSGHFVSANRIEGTWRLDKDTGPFAMTRN